MKRDTNRTAPMKVNATPADKATIKAAAKAARMSVSQYLLLAGLERAGKQTYIFPSIEPEYSQARTRDLLPGRTTSGG